uniref:Uncharacterized protein n=1 Tax=Avena sativa TaxID=4498 RepID=A0ACD5ZFP7_AVESA
MAERLASVPEESTTVFPAPHPPSSSYRESIRSVDGPEWRIRSSLFPQSSYSGSSYSSSYSGGSNISGCSFGMVSAGVSGFGDGEITKIAHKMVSDGYLQQMVQAFGDQDSDTVLEAWFSELDVPWVLQSRESHGSQFQLQPQELVERWIRSLTLIVVSIEELVAAGDASPAVARFGRASISVMLDFGHTLNLSMPENLQAMLHMYVCVSAASYHMVLVEKSCYMMVLPFLSEARSVVRDTGGLLKRGENKLVQAISDIISKAKVMAFGMVDDSWDIEIVRGRGEVHRSVRMLVDCIVSMREAQASSKESAQSHNIEKLHNLIDDAMDYLKNMIEEKSELCLDPSLRYIFLLNNYNFLAQVVYEPSISLDLELLSAVHHQGLELTPECKKQMDSYLEVSWGQVLSCISASKISGPLRRWISNSSLAKFHSAFHKTYKAQKFWKVPDPRLRSLLREAITKRVISAYRDYLKEHPADLEKQVSAVSSDPDVLEEMVGELFEGR